MIMTRLGLLSRHLGLASALVQSLAVAALVVAACSPATPAAPIAPASGPAALAPAEPPREAAPASWQVAWREQLPSFLTAMPQVGDGLIYVFTGNTVHALDLATGAPAWTVKPPPPQGRALLLGCCMTVGAPTTEGVYTLAGGNEVRALDPATGATRWQRAVGEAILVPPMAAQPVVAVLTLEGQETVLYALTAVTGETAWQARPGRILPRFAALRGTFFVPLSGGAVAAYSAPEGRQSWVSAQNGRTQPLSPRQFGDEVLVIPTADGVVALDLATGAQRWAAFLPGLPLELLVLGRVVYVRTIDGTAVALDLADGREHWRAEMGSFVRALYGVSEGYLLATGRNGLIALDSATGARLWERMGVAVFAPPLAADGVVYVATRAGGRAGELLVLDPPTGSERARVALGAPASEESGDLTLASNGLLLVPTEAETGTILVAIRRPERDR